MEEKFDLEKIDFKNIPEENRIWVLLLLLFSFWGEKDVEKLERIKNKLQNDLKEWEYKEGS